jgi:hypothetical protein
MDCDGSKYVVAASAEQPGYLQQAHTLLLQATGVAFDSSYSGFLFDSSNIIPDLHKAGWYLYAWAQSVLEQQVSSPKMLEVMLGPAALDNSLLRQVWGTGSGVLQACDPTTPLCPVCMPHVPDERVPGCWCSVLAVARPSCVSPD